MVKNYLVTIKANNSDDCDVLANILKHHSYVISVIEKDELLREVKDAGCIVRLWKTKWYEGETIYYQTIHHKR